MARSERTRFNIYHDLCLLREVVGLNPWEDETRWKTVQSSIERITGKQFTLRCLKDHVEHLLKLYRKEDRANLRKSGTEEQYDEKERLLQEVNDLWREFKQNASISKKHNLSREKGINMRNAATYNYAEDSDHNLFNEHDYNGMIFEEDSDPSHLPNTNVQFEMIPEDHQTVDPVANITGFDTPNSRLSESSTVGPIRVRKNRYLIKNSSLKFLEERQEMERRIREKQFEIEEKKLQLEERKLKLEEEKFYLEKAEREHRLSMEMKERESHVLLAEAQQKMMSALIDKCIK